MQVVSAGSKMKMLNSIQVGIKMMLPVLCVMPPDSFYLSLLFNALRSGSCSQSFRVLHITSSCSFCSHLSTILCRYLRISGVEPPHTLQHSASFAASAGAGGASSRVQPSTFTANSSMMSSVAADNLYHYGDISGRIAQLQQQSLQGQAVIDANSQQQVCITEIHVSVDAY